MHLVAKFAMVATAAAGAMLIDIAPGRAFGDAPWCAVVEIGSGEVYWDCEYRTIEECRPNVIAGNRGFCNLNPNGPGAAARPPAHRHTRKPHSPN